MIPTETTLVKKKHLFIMISIYGRRFKFVRKFNIEIVYTETTFSSTKNAIEIP